MNDGSCIRLRPQHRFHVWSYDFVHHQTNDGRPLRLLTLMDEFSRECLSIDVGRKLNGDHVLDRLTQLFKSGRIPQYLRSDNGSKFTSLKVRNWLERLEVKTLFIEPGSPWENGYIESFNGKGRDELLNAGDDTTTKFVHTVYWATSHRLPRPFGFQAVCQLSLRSSNEVSNPLDARIP